MDPRAGALFGEPGSRLVNLGPVELVVPEHVEDVRGARPVIRKLVNKPFGVGREVARKDDDVRRRVVLRHVAPMLKMEVGEDLDLHGTFNPLPVASCEARGGSRAAGPSAPLVRVPYGILSHFHQPLFAVFRRVQVTSFLAVGGTMRQSPCERLLFGPSQEAWPLVKARSTACAHCRSG